MFSCLSLRLRFGLATQGHTASACSFSTFRLNLALTYRVPPAFLDGVHSFVLSTAIWSVPSLSGNAIAYRWRSLPRVHRHRASNLQDSSSNGCCLFRYHMDHFLCASLFAQPLSVQLACGIHIVSEAGSFDIFLPSRPRTGLATTYITGYG